MFLMPCFESSTHESLADSWGESSFNSIKTGSSVTPDPIKLLAVVHHRDMNDNTAKDNWKEREKHDTLETTSMTVIKL